MSEFVAIVVGCGRIGSRYDERRGPAQPPLTHAGAYAAADEVTLVGGVDTDPVARDAFEKRWGVPAAASIHELEWDGPLLVSVCTPAAAQCKLVEDVLSVSPAAFWLEKPLAETVSEGETILELCAAAKIPVQVNFLRRFDPFHRLTVEKIQADGPPCHLVFRFSESLRNFGSHAFDLFHWICGETTSVTALADPNGSPIVAAHANGSSATFQQVPLGGVALFDLDVYTRRAHFVLTALGEQLLCGRCSAEHSPYGVVRHWFEPAVATGDLTACMSGGLASLLAAVRLGTPPLCDGSDGLASLRVLEAAESAIERQVPVTLNG